MQYGFIIDNRKCIGCHACTVACKSEHDVPVGVNRTWVKQTEKGVFPNSNRVFSVLRCNHCTDAPCVDICPTTALFIREDGIVDFDNRRCIGCKSCMQACPYDALYIDPETHTAAKCNYCAHRVDKGLEPACVNVCPEHAIVSGDIDNPETEIAQLLSREQVTVRKQEKGTKPNLYYINGDEASLNPNSTERSENYIWNAQTSGVGHFSKFAEARIKDNEFLNQAKENSGQKLPGKVMTMPQPQVTSAQALMKKGGAKRVYDTPDKGILWGWEVSAYVWTKAIAAGVIMVSFIANLFGTVTLFGNMWLYTTLVSLVFLILTTIFLVKDLDQPKRFVFVILRPHWGSWLVKGGYALTVFGGLITLMLVAWIFKWQEIGRWSFYLAAATSVIVAIYTAFLFAQAKGRDFWQSPALAIHMLVHSIMAGAAAMALISYLAGFFEIWKSALSIILIGAIILNVVVIAFEMMMTHPTADVKKVIHSILKGQYSNRFWIGTIAVGNIIPLVILAIGGSALLPMAGVFTLIGIYITEDIWVEAPQRIPLT